MSSNDFINILIVDDIEDNLILLESILDNPEYKLLRAFSGKEALTILSQIQVALIIMDVQMPQLSGFEVAQLIKKNSHLTSIPIIFVSANTDFPSSMLKGYQVGAADYISKPINAEILSAKVAIFVQLFKKNKELEIAKELAENANQAKSRFLAIVGHEIRNSISGIAGLADLLLDTKPTEEQQSYIESITNSSERSLAIINDLLDLSKIEANKLKLEEIDFNPKQILEQLVTLFGATFKNKNLELVSYVDPNMPTLAKGDPVRLYQILSNLLSNAIKFTEKGTVAVFLVLLRETKTQLTVKFSVSDTGKGIAPENQSSLFQPYIQEDISISRKFGGTGLGLSICQKLVELMGGNIHLESKIDQGTTFWFTVKFNKVPIASNSVDLTTHLNNLFVALISPTSIFSSTLIKQLTSWKTRCQHLTNIEKAIEKYSEEFSDLPSVIIWNVPTLDQGFVILLEKIKLSNPNFFQKITLLIPFWEQNYFHKLPIAKIPYLTKPLSPSKFFKHLLNFSSKTSLNPVYKMPKNKIYTPTTSKPKSILVVEDDDINQVIIKKQLMHFGYNFDIVGTGQEALNELKNKSYDLLLLDCYLPDISGFEITTEIRKRELELNKSKKLCNLPIIALTAITSSAEQQKCYSVGMNDVLTKPISMKTLADVFKTWL